MTDRAAFYGLTAKSIEPVVEQGDVVLIGEEAFPRDVAAKRKRLEERVKRDGFGQTMEAMAYTWFNRLAAIRYMELHGYLDHGYRVLSHPEGQEQPEILDHATDIDLPGLDHDKAVDLKLDGSKDEELYRLLLKAQCNALHQAMPFLFEQVGDETELLLPANLLHTDSLIRRLVEGIDESDWDEIEIVGWLYQFYISEKKDEVIGKVVKSEDIPAATQLFTPNWIVKYMVQNSLGAQWLATYPNSPLKGQMDYYIEPAEQTDEVNAQLKAITPDSLNPEELTLIDPACGSGHILVEAYDLFKAIYLERGYRQRDVPKLILEKNLFGLDIDERAAQLTGFALMMTGRADDRRLFERGVKLNVMALVDSTSFDAERLSEGMKLADYGLRAGDLTELKRLSEHATTFGSLIQVPGELAAKLYALRELSEATSRDLFVSDALKRLGPLVKQAELLAAQYDTVVANPPYMGSKGMNALLKKFATEKFPRSKSDLFAVCTERFLDFATSAGFVGLMTPFTWMSLKSYEAFRTLITGEKTLRSLIQPEYHAFFDSAYVPVCTFIIQNVHASGYEASFISLSDFYGVELQPLKTLEAINNPDCNWFYTARPDEFKKIPGSPVTYWLSERMRELFVRFSPLGDHAESREGMATANNDKFLRFYYEVPHSNIGWNCNSSAEASASPKKWFPYIKGGSYRKWYGNLEYVVDWFNDGEDIKKNIDPTTGRLRSHNYNGQYAFQEGFTWTVVSSSSTGARIVDAGFMFDASGPLAFSPQDVRYLAVALINSCVGESLLKAISPTLGFKHGHILMLPLDASHDNAQQVKNCVAALRQNAEKDWNAYERSWDFQSLPILMGANDGPPNPGLQLHRLDHA